MHLRELLPTRDEWRRSAAPIARGSVVGFLTGLVPGPATVLATFISYTLERKVSKTPERFGQGAIEGVAGPEAANNGATAGAMVPLLSLGIPFSPATAILLGALVITGIAARPAADQPAARGVLGRGGQHVRGQLHPPRSSTCRWSASSSACCGCPSTCWPRWCCCCAWSGAYSLNNSQLDLWVLVAFGIFGYGLRKLAIDPSPLVVALVLGPIMEKTLRQTLFMERGRRPGDRRPAAHADPAPGRRAGARGPLVMRLLRRPRIAPEVWGRAGERGDAPAGPARSVRCRRVPTRPRRHRVPTLAGPAPGYPVSDGRETEGQMRRPPWRR